MDTKKLRQKILDLAIHGKLVPQDPNDEPASVLLERIRAEKERLISEGKIKRSRKTVKTSDTHHYENDVPFEVPKGWVWTTLENCTINRDNERIPIASAIRNKQQNKKYDYYGAAGIIDKVDNYIFNERLLLVGEDGANLLSRAKNNAFFAEGKFWVNNHAHILDSYPKKVLDFVAIVINSMNLEMYITGSAQPKLSQDNLNRIPIPLPPFAEQQRIVAEIERWFALIDTIEKSKEGLETAIKQAKNKILDLAIHGKLVPQDPNDEPASELLKRINPKAQIPCDNGHYAQLPKGWSICELMDVAKIVTGSTPSKSNLSYYGGNFPLYKPSDLDAGRHTNTASEYLTTKGRDVSRIIPPNSIAICCIGSIGKVGYIEQEGTTNQQINTAIPSLAIFPDYLYHLCTSTYFQNSLMEKSSAVTISIVNKSKMEHIKIPLPPKEEQARIVVAIDNLFNALDAVKENL